VFFIDTSGGNEYERIMGLMRYDFAIQSLIPLE
jgi:hypothetical protein